MSPSEPGGCFPQVVHLSLLVVMDLLLENFALFCRRGSNVSLTLDMCTPGCSEQGFGYVMSPREQSAREYLQTASNILTEEELHKKALDPFILQAEFFVSV